MVANRITKDKRHRPDPNKAKINHTYLDLQPEEEGVEVPQELRDAHKLDVGLGEVALHLFRLIEN